MTTPVYLDNHATTKVDPRVLAAMLPWFGEEYGNASSRQHAFGWRAEAAVELARGRVARLIGAESREVIFTSGATESINLAIKGIVQAGTSRGNHVVTSAVEHPAVLDTCRALERQGVEVTVLPVDRHGRVAPEDVTRAITPRTVLVSIMTANNEVGTLEPVAAIGSLCAERGVPFHSDAAQAVGRVPVDVRTMNVTALSFSAHKMYGPKGVGALYLRSTRPPVPLVPQMDGGGHERGLRSGTLNVPGIVGFGEAASIALAEQQGEADRIRGLRDRLEAGLAAALPDITVNGDPSGRLPHNASITFVGARADRIMMEMKDVAVSAGSACGSADAGPSHVLKALGLAPAAAASTLRFGLGRFTTEEEIDYTIRRVVETVAAIRARMPKLEPA